MLKVAAPLAPSARSLESQRLERMVQTPVEEFVNVLTHGVGLLLAIAATALLITNAALGGSAIHVVCASIFGAGLILVYASSTGFHMAGWKNWGKENRNRWRLCDHAAIYVLIAATYTPIMLVAVGGAWGWSIFGVIWGLAIAGIGLKLATVGRFDSFDRVDTFLYLAMGWLCLVAIVPIWSSLSTAGFVWMLVGGLFYSVGCVFFLWNRLPFNHAIWHGFVLGGSASHFFLIFLHVAPM